MAYRALVLLCLFFSFSAHSSVVVSPVIQGYSAAAHTYQGTAAAANSGFAAEGIINVGGRAAAAPATMRFAANAGQYALAAARLNPTVLAVGAIAAWLLPYGLEYINGQWMKKVNTAVPSDALCGTSASECASRSSFTYTQYGPHWDSTSGGYCYGSLSDYPAIQFGCGVTGSTAPSPATDANWAAVPTSTLPNAVADQLADTHPVPVQDPVFSPADVATGPAYTKPDGSTAEPRAKISPAGPGQVTVDTYEKPLTNPDGTPAPVDAPVQDTPEPPKDPCEEHPDRVGCVELGSPDSDVAKTQTHAFAYTAEGAAFSGSCPAPLSILGKTLSYQPACDAMTMIKPLILGLASLMAGYILIGAFRET